MAKYMVLYNGTGSAKEVMANTTPEDMKVSMDEWIAWRDQAAKTAEVEFGLPLDAVSSITSNGVAASNSHVSGYSIIESDSKDTVIELLQTHPHLKQPGNSIDVLEMLPMPGM